MIKIEVKVIASTQELAETNFDILVNNIKKALSAGESCAGGSGDTFFSITYPQERPLSRHELRKLRELIK